MSASQPSCSSALRREIPAASTDLLAALSASEQARLLEAVRTAKRRQKQALDAAINEGLGFVPVLLRGVLKRILFP